MSTSANPQASERKSAAAGLLTGTHRRAHYTNPNLSWYQLKQGLRSSTSQVTVALIYTAEDRDRSSSKAIPLLWNGLLSPIHVGLFRVQETSQNSFLKSLWLKANVGNRCHINMSFYFIWKTKVLQWMSFSCQINCIITIWQSVYGNITHLTWLCAILSFGWQTAVRIINHNRLQRVILSAEYL